jgi:hypothetical protein
LAFLYGSLSEPYVITSTIPTTPTGLITVSGTTKVKTIKKIKDLRLKEDEKKIYT